VENCIDYCGEVGRAGQLKVYLSESMWRRKKVSYGIVLMPKGRFSTEFGASETFLRNKQRRPDGLGDEADPCKSSCLGDMQRCVVILCTKSALKIDWIWCHCPFQIGFQMRTEKVLSTTFFAFSFLSSYRALALKPPIVCYDWIRAANAKEKRWASACG
jgi:hypothetical protein